MGKADGGRVGGGGAGHGRRGDGRALAAEVRKVRGAAAVAVGRRVARPGHVELRGRRDDVEPVAVVEERLEAELGRVVRDEVRDESARVAERRRAPRARGLVDAVHARREPRRGARPARVVDEVVEDAGRRARRRVRGRRGRRRGRLRGRARGRRRPGDGQRAQRRADGQRERRGAGRALRRREVERRERDRVEAAAAAGPAGREQRLEPAAAGAARELTEGPQRRVARPREGRRRAALRDGPPRARVGLADDGRGERAAGRPVEAVGAARGRVEELERDDEVPLAGERRGGLDAERDPDLVAAAAAVGVGLALLARLLRAPRLARDGEPQGPRGLEGAVALGAALVERQAQPLVACAEIKSSTRLQYDRKR